MLFSVLAVAYAAVGSLLLSKLHETFKLSYRLIRTESVVVVVTLVLMELIYCGFNVMLFMWEEELVAVYEESALNNTWVTPGLVTTYILWEDLIPAIAHLMSLNFCFCKGLQASYSFQKSVAATANSDSWLWEDDDTSRHDVWDKLVRRE